MKNELRTQSELWRREQSCALFPGHSEEVAGNRRRGSSAKPVLPLRDQVRHGKAIRTAQQVKVQVRLGSASTFYQYSRRADQTQREIRDQFLMQCIKDGFLPSSEYKLQLLEQSAYSIVLVAAKLNKQYLGEKIVILDNQLKLVPSYNELLQAYRLGCTVDFLRVQNNHGWVFFKGPLIVDPSCIEREVRITTHSVEVRSGLEWKAELYYKGIAPFREVVPRLRRDLQMRGLQYSIDEEGGSWQIRHSQL